VKFAKDRGKIRPARGGRIPEARGPALFEFSPAVAEEIAAGELCPGCLAKRGEEHPPQPWTGRACVELPRRPRRATA